MAAVVSVGAGSGEVVAPEGQLMISPGSSEGKSTHSGRVLCAPLHKKAFSAAAVTCSRRNALGKKAITASAATSHSGGKALGKKAYAVPEGTYQPLRKALGNVNTTTGVMSKMPETKQESQPLRKALGKVNTTTGVLSKMPERKQESQPERKQESQPERKQESQPERKQESQPERKQESQPERKQESQSTAVKTDEKTELSDCWISQSDEDLAECKEEKAESEEDWPEIENMFHFDPQDFDNFDVPDECKLSNLDLRGVPLMIYPRTYNRCVEEKPTLPPTPEMSFISSLLQANADFIASLEKLHFPELPPFPADFYEEQECCNGF